MCVFVCVCTRMRTNGPGGHQRALDPRQLESQETVSHTTWMQDWTQALKEQCIVPNTESCSPSSRTEEKLTHSTRVEEILGRHLLECDCCN